MIKVRSGFSLIELMVVIAIVSVLSAAAVPSYRSYMTKVKIGTVTSVLSAYKIRAIDFYNRTGSWPTSMNDIGGAPSGIPYVSSINLCSTGCGLAVNGGTNYAGAFGIYAILTAAQVPGVSGTTPAIALTAQVSNDMTSWTCTTYSASQDINYNIPKALLPGGCVSPDAT